MCLVHSFVTFLYFEYTAVILSVHIKVCLRKSHTDSNTLLKSVAFDCSDSSNYYCLQMYAIILIQVLTPYYMYRLYGRLYIWTGRTLRGADWDSYIFIIESQFCVTKVKFNLVSQIEFCVTNNFNSVPQKSIWWNKIKLCVTKFNSVTQNLILLHRIYFLGQNWILCHKIQFSVTKLNFVSQNWILCHKIEFCVTKLNFVSQNWILCH